MYLPLGQCNTESTILASDSHRVISLEGTHSLVRIIAGVKDSCVVVNLPKNIN